jgi:hypothetical protein
LNSGFEKGLTNYLRIRKTWLTLFTDDELEALEEIGILESKSTIKSRNLELENLITAAGVSRQKLIEFRKKRDSRWPNGRPTQILEAQQLYDSELPTEERLFADVMLGRFKLNEFLMQGTDMADSAELVHAAAIQLLMADKRDIHALPLLFDAHERGLHLTLMQVKMAINMTEQVEINPFGSWEGMPEATQILLDVLGLSGNEFLEQFGDFGSKPDNLTRDNKLQREWLSKILKAARRYAEANQIIPKHISLKSVRQLEFLHWIGLLDIDVGGDRRSGDEMIFDHFPAGIEPGEIADFLELLEQIMPGINEEARRSVSLRDIEKELGFSII